MATDLFPITTAAGYHLGTNTARADGSTGGWDSRLLSTSRGSVTSTNNQATVAGPTNGLEALFGGFPLEFFSLPLAADVLISGLMTFQIWASENSMSANVGPQFIVERVTSQGVIASTIINTERGVELPTSGAAQQWTATPTSTQMFRGDRIRVRMLGNDAGGNMASGFTFNISFGSGAGGTGDSWLRFNENLTFETAEPTGSPLYLTADAATIPSPARGQLAAKLSAGSAAVDASTDTVGSWPAPVRVEDRIEQISLQGTTFFIRGGTGTTGETHQAQAQGFRPPTTQTVDEVVVWINRVGLPLDNIVVEIREGSQTGTLVASAFAVGATLGTTAAAVAFAFGGETLTGGSLYYLVLTRSGARDITNYYEWQIYFNNAYASDDAYKRDNNSWAVSTDDDFRFEINDTTVANLEWLSEQLQAFTLGGRAKGELYGMESNTNAEVSWRCEIAVCDSDGSNPVVWGAGNSVELLASLSTRSMVIAGDDVNVAQGQRIRVRVQIHSTEKFSMASGHTARLVFNDASSYVILPQTVSEYSAVTPSDPPIHLLQRQPYKTLIVR